MILVKLLSHLLLMFALLASTQSLAEELEPFQSWIAKRPQWSDDEGEVSYAYTRCGTLLMILGRIFIANPSVDDDLRVGKDSKDRGSALLLFGNMLGNSKGMSNEFLSKRFDLVSKSYLDRITINRRLHNNMFHGYILSDYHFCLKIEAELRDAINRESAKRSQ